MKNATAAAMLGIAMLACNGFPEPDPPGPNPGFDCNEGLDLSGVIEVEDAVPDRYIVVLRPAPAGVKEKSLAIPSGIAVSAESST